MTRNKYYYRALAMKRKTPREMLAKYAGTCAACGKSFPAGAAIVYYGATRECWHQECYFSLNAAGKDPIKASDPDPEPTTPQPEPEPTTPQIAEIRLDTGVASVKCWTDNLIKFDGKTIFLSLLGSDSTVKACNGQFVNGRAGSISDALYCKPENDYSFRVLRDNRAPKYRYWPTKLQDRGAHLICCDERFLPGISLEKDIRYLLAGPDQDAAALVFGFLKKNLATPVMPDWQSTIFEHLKTNANRHYYNSGMEYQARAQAIPASIGNLTAWKIEATEESFDALVTRLIQAGEISF